MFVASGRELWVGATEQYKKIADAVAAARDGDTVYVRAGTYVNDWATVNVDLRIVGVGGLAHLQSTTAIANGKAALITNADVVIENLEFSGARVADNNGAGIRYQAGDLTVRNSSFHDNENGILGAANATGHIVIQDSEFARNGRGDGYTHGAYIGQVASLEVTGSYFHDTNVGSHLKSRAAGNLIVGNRFIDGVNGNASYNIDLPNGGTGVIRDNLIDQAATTSNRAMVHFGGEVANPVGSLLVEDNVFTNARSIATGVLNQTILPVTIRDNAFSNVTYIAEGGATVQQGNYTRFAGAAGSSTIIGGAGLDQVDYGTSPAAVRVDLAAGTAQDGFGFTDKLTAIDYAKGGGFADTLTGTAAANRLEGGEGDDSLTGGAGNDSLDGGAGSDVAVFSGDAASYRAAGTAAAFTITGADGTDTVSGVEAVRFADRTMTAAELFAPATVPSIGGTAANDTLKGTAGADTIDGGAGADRMEGGTGDDTYIVDNAGDFTADLTTAAGGSDTVRSIITWSIARQGYGIEHLVLTGTADIHGTGNTAANRITGTAGHNVLDGAGGADTLEGGAGDDIYVVDNAGDVVTEASGQGVDTVRSSVAFTLGANQENLVLTGAIWVAGTGNALDNQITGNVQANKLNGGAGNDTLSGGGGKDTLTGGAGSDLFRFASLSDAGSVIKDLAVGDHIDLGALSLGADPLGAGILKLTTSGTNTLLAVDLDGAGAGKPVTLVTIEAVGMATVRDALLF